MKYKGKEYSVRDCSCKKLTNICFIPFSGNGINICRKWELGQCPSEEQIRELKRIKRIKEKNENK